MTDSAERLDPCPFCGGQPSDTPTIEQIEYNSWVASINCNRCYISMTPQFTEPSEAGAIASAIAAWNRRPPAEAGAPDGWKLVPEILTADMRNAASKKDNEAMDDSGQPASIEGLWLAMIASSPAAPKEGSC